MKKIKVSMGTNFWAISEIVYQFELTNALLPYCALKFIKNILIKINVGR